VGDDVQVSDGQEQHPSRAAAGTIAVVEENGVPVIRLSGEIDETVVAAYVDVERPGPQAAVIDASGVTFLDGRGLRFLLCSTEVTRSGGVRPVLRRPARVVRRLVDLAGVRGCFSITL
jgi:anti-anti-sigma factor